MQESAAEEILQGGNTSVVVRVGDPVRRRTGHWTPAVHALLAHLESSGSATPRPSWASMCGSGGPGVRRG